MTGPHRGRRHEHDHVQPAEHNVFRRLSDLAEAFREIDEAGGMLAAYRRQLHVPDWVQPPPAVGRAEQLHALDVITTDLRDQTDELDRKMRALMTEINRPLRPHDERD